MFSDTMGGPTKPKNKKSRSGNFWNRPRVVFLVKFCISVSGKGLSLPQISKGMSISCLPSLSVSGWTVVQIWGHRGPLQSQKTRPYMPKQTRFTFNHAWAYLGPFFGPEGGLYGPKFVLQSTPTPTRKADMI